MQKRQSLSQMTYNQVKVIFNGKQSREFEFPLEPIIGEETLVKSLKHQHVKEKCV